SAEFVGHPLGELRRPSGSREDYALKHSLDHSKPWIALMPGSRIKEVRMNLPGMLGSAALLDGGFEFLLPVAPTLDRAVAEDLLRGLSGERRRRIHLVDEALPALAHARAGVIASGTATVEAAMMETPFVMVYRVNPLTYRVGRSLVKVPYFAMVNLIAGEQVVAELVQDDFTGERVRAELNKIIPSGHQREKMLAQMRRVKTLLRGGDNSSLPPIERAAQSIADLMDRHSTQQLGLQGH
ncbi:MAG: lipid-A-disaccharide synthase, partial [Acidobacteria bacterium]|nr:lipid-A-disaccharide synthase [Acidobacteriota bacterium]